MTEFPPPVLPNAILYDAAFVTVLVLVLGLVALVPLLRRIYFAAVLIPIAFVEFYIVVSAEYSLPLELTTFGIPFVTLLSGIIVVVLYAIRRILRKKIANFLLISSGCIELALGAISLLNLDVVGFPYENGFYVVDLNYQLFLLGSILSTVGIYSLIFGAFLRITELKRDDLIQTRIKS